MHQLTEPYQDQFGKWRVECICGWSWSAFEDKRQMLREAEAHQLSAPQKIWRAIVGG